MNYAALLAELLTAIENYRAAETKNWMIRNEATKNLRDTMELCNKAIQTNENQEPNTTD